MDAVPARLHSSAAYKDCTAELAPVFSACSETPCSTPAFAKSVVQRRSLCHLGHQFAGEGRDRYYHLSLISTTDVTCCTRASLPPQGPLSQLMARLSTSGQALAKAAGTAHAATSADTSAAPGVAAAAATRGQPAANLTAAAGAGALGMAGASVGVGAEAGGGGGASADGHSSGAAMVWTAAMADGGDGVGRGGRVRGAGCGGGGGGGRGVVDPLAAAQAHVYCVAGACLALGIKYAGTADQRVSNLSESDWVKR